MGEELKTEYEIVLTKSGTGAADAAAELRGLQQVAAQTSGAVSGTDKGLTTLGNSTKTATSTMRVLQATATAVGLQAFPQMASAGVLVEQSLKAIRASSTEVTAGVGLTAISIAGLIATLISAAEAWATYKSRQEETFTTQALEAQTRSFALKLRDNVTEVYKQGKITVDDYDQLMSRLKIATRDGNQSVRDELTRLQRGTAADKIADLERSIKFSQLSNEQEVTPRQRGTAEDLQSRLFMIENYFNRRKELYAQLREQGLLTEEDLMDAETEASITRMQQLAALKKELTDVQQVGRSASEAFASGLSTTLVDVRAWTKDAGAAFAKFFADLASQIAQMIIQLLILRALKSAFPSLFGAADGGMFPTMAASGLAGVGEVSRPTYFPKFNVVAGEAGREMLTVLAKPRYMQLGGIQAVVGNAGRNRLAITNADDLADQAGGSISGRAVIEVRPAPGYEASIISDAIDGAELRVTQNVRRHTPLRQAVKQASI